MTTNARLAALLRDLADQIEFEAEPELQGEELLLDPLAFAGWLVRAVFELGRERMYYEPQVSAAGSAPEPPGQTELDL